MRPQRLLLSFLALCPLLLGTTSARSTVALVPLDGGQAAVQGVHVLAMAMSPDGALYAGGRDTYDPRTPDQPNPYGLGSVFMVSRDHGAHWTKRVTREPSPGYVAHYPPWTDHTRWPANFSVSQLVVDPHRPATLYAAGGFPFSRAVRGPNHLLLRSTDAGQTWTEILVRHINLASRPPLFTNIVVTPANRQDLTYRHIYNVLGFAVDPHDTRHLYAGTDALGVLRSTDGGATWQYNPASPGAANHVTEQLVLDPQRPATVYVLVQDTTQTFLYRSDDSGSHWQKLWQGGFASGVFLEFGSLYMVRADGVFATRDRGLHWHLALDPRNVPGYVTPGAAGTILQALHDQQTGLWMIVTDISGAADPFSLFATSNNGSTWRLLTHGDREIGKGLALAIQDMNYGYKRMWFHDHGKPLILFTASDQDRLYRWKVSP